MPEIHNQDTFSEPFKFILKTLDYARKQKDMNQTAKIAVALFAAFALVGAVAAVAAELSTSAFARSSFNNQQNFQGFANFNNQQFKSNFQCVGCNP
jgi:hypothetical protein